MTRPAALMAQMEGAGHKDAIAGVPLSRPVGGWRLGSCALWVPDRCFDVVVDAGRGQQSVRAALVDPDS